MHIQCHEAKKYHEKIENLNYGTSIHGEHVFRLDATPGVKKCLHCELCYHRERENFSIWPDFGPILYGDFGHFEFE